MIGKCNQLLLVVEDSDEDFAVFYRVIKQQGVVNPIFRCTDGDDALDYLYHDGEYSDNLSFPCPAMIILDLNLPGTDGREFLEQIKQDINLRKIPIVIFTTSSNPKDIDICYYYCIASYLLKPIDIKKLVATIQAFVNYWLDIVILPDHVSN